jgi:hypothetical protein
MDSLTRISCASSRVAGLGIHIMLGMQLVTDFIRASGPSEV